MLDIDTIIIIYENTPTFENGAIAKIVDRDPHDESYAVAELSDIYKENGDITKILERHVKWVKVHDFYPVYFERKKTWTQRLKEKLLTLFEN